MSSMGALGGDENGHLLDDANHEYISLLGLFTAKYHRLGGLT